jgi:hypothetical protein
LCGTSRIVPTRPGCRPKQGVTFPDTILRFPVRLATGLRRSLRFALCCGPESLHDNYEIPVDFPVSRENGSHQTAPSATQSAIARAVERSGWRPRLLAHFRIYSGLLKLSKSFSDDRTPNASEVLWGRVAKSLSRSQIFSG